MAEWGRPPAAPLPLSQPTSQPHVSRPKDMNVEQRTAAHGLLQSVLSSQGYLKATGVMQLEGILGQIEGRPERRDPEDYYFNIFGTPSEDGAWAWRFEGHHISMNFAAAGGELPSVTPAFLGLESGRGGRGPERRATPPGSRGGSGPRAHGPLH